MDLSFFLPTKIHFSLQAIEKIGIIAGEFGVRTLIIADDILPDYHHIKTVKSHLETKGLKSIVFDEVSSYSTSKVVEQAAGLAKTSKTQLIIGMGGVKALSVAKCAAQMVVEDKPFDSYLSGTRFTNKGLPYIEVPTTCRNPTMFTRKALIIDARDRYVKEVNLYNYPEVVIIDPALTVTLSGQYTVTTMFDTLLLSFEGFVSKKGNFLSEILFKNTFAPLLQNIQKAHDQPEDLSIRRIASEAGVLNALGLSMSYAGLGYALSSIISGKFRVPQAAVSTILLPHVLEFCLEHCPNKLLRIARLLEKEDTVEEEASARNMIDRIRHQIASMRLPMRLNDLGLKYGELTSSIEGLDSFEGISYLPASITQDEILALVKQAF